MGIKNSPILNVVKLVINHLRSFTTKYPQKKKFRRMLLIFWLSPALIFWNRGVQGSFHVYPFGEVEEYNSLDSASWNGRYFYNQQQNVHDEGKNHNVHPTYQVSGDSSNQMADGNSNWEADAISPLDEWFNHSDSVPNLEEAMNYYPQDHWNYAQVEHSSFSGQNHQEKTYPHVGSSQDFGSSSNAYQPMYDGELFGGNHVNLFPHFDESQYQDNSVMPKPNQNFGIPFDHQMTQYPTSHSMLNDFLYSPNLSEMRDRVYQKQDSNEQDFSPTSSSHNSGSFHTGTAFDLRGNSIDNENLISGTSMSPAEKHSKDRHTIIKILKNNFSRNSPKAVREKLLHKCSIFKDRHLELIHKETLEFINRHDFEEGSQAKFILKNNVNKDEESIIGILKTRMVFVYTLNIIWDDPIPIKKRLYDFAKGFKLFENEVDNKITREHIKDISNLGITFMKIIAKKYSDAPVSKEFEDDLSILNYTKSFWHLCFISERATNQQFRDFFLSLRKTPSREFVDQFLSTKFSLELEMPKNIFLGVKNIITKKSSKTRILPLSWYFVYFRAIFYYPQIFFVDGKLSGDELISAIEDGIVYCFELDKIPKQ
ncbi:expressed protein [Phakopsora pachyrhizi]|uniref:Expressed protein n=1 Tax=Phakopsora pachyrhizi TaxID=170000 RepID=A0AAV0BJZ0_PHAPC|nr:expressed protein [Phakopsora pachyrhizi]